MRVIHNCAYCGWDCGMNPKRDEEGDPICWHCDRKDIAEKCKPTDTHEGRERGGEKGGVR